VPCFVSLKQALYKIKNEPEINIAKKNINEFLTITNDVISELNLNFNDIKLDKKKLMEAKQEIANFKKSAKRNFLVLDGFGSNQKRRRSDSKVITSYKPRQTEEETPTPFLTGIKEPNSSYNTKLKKLFKAHEENPKINLNKLAITDIAPGKLRIKETRRTDQIFEQKINPPSNTFYKPIGEVIFDIKKQNDKHRYDDAEELKVIQKYKENLEKVNSKVSTMLERAKKESISELNYKKISKY
jgi:hypothetical protein